MPRVSPTFSEGNSLPGTPSVSEGGANPFLATLARQITSDKLKSSPRLAHFTEDDIEAAALLASFRDSPPHAPAAYEQTYSSSSVVDDDYSDQSSPASDSPQESESESGSFSKKRRADANPETASQELKRARLPSGSSSRHKKRQTRPIRRDVERLVERILLLDQVDESDEASCSPIFRSIERTTDLWCEKYDFSKPKSQGKDDLLSWVRRSVGLYDGEDFVDEVVNRAKIDGQQARVALSDNTLVKCESYMVPLRCTVACKQHRLLHSLCPSDCDRRQLSVHARRRIQKSPNTYAKAD